MPQTEGFDWMACEEPMVLEAAHQINKASLLFEKIEDEAIQKQLDKLEATKKAIV